MGRISTGAYDELQKNYGSEIIGVEHASERVDFNRGQGRNVILGDACDTEFWLNGPHRRNLRMNFKFMPELHWPWGYLLLLLFMLGMMMTLLGAPPWPGRVSAPQGKHCTWRDAGISG